jgi:amino acid transporter
MAVRARQLGPFAVRSTEILIAEGGEEHHTLKRAVGALDLTALGVGAIIGTGTFVVIGEGAGDAGPAVTVSFVLAAVTCLFSALSYAELASSIPIAGSAYTYTYATLGEVIAWIIGWTSSSSTASPSPRSRSAGAATSTSSSTPPSGSGSRTRCRPPRSRAAPSTSPPSSSSSP